MEYVYASLLLHYAKKPITEENVKKVLEAVGVSVDEVRLKALVAALKEIDIEEAIKSAAVPVAAPAAVATAAPTAAPAAEEKKEEEKEKKEEASEEEIAEGLASLFG
ncbi:MAG: 50S ribosomal protein P1 [Thermoprotei archaeon]|nr:MAG: 50S ribosomal protein P1 [Thermoprotei archaeon]RLF00420.1 MAG: 50S ribosomal protein P1 [Thermoprotei archaeon]